MANAKNKEITKTVEVAAKILEEKPHLKYSEAIKEAKERIGIESKHREE